MMKAALAASYGSPDVITLSTIDAPRVGPDDLLVQVRATTVSSGDARVRAARFPRGFGWIAPLMFGWKKPRNPVLGAEASGVVLAVGAKVTRFKPGDEVFGLAGMRMGAHAEQVVLSQRGAVALKPKNVSFEHAAALCFGGTTMLSYYRRARLARGERVLVNGATGAVGVAAIQLAKQSGAHVTAVCSARGEALARSLGADEVIDYEREDFCARTAAWDVIVDCVGNAPYARSVGALRERGRFVAVVAGLYEIVSALWINAISSKKLIAGPIDELREDAERLAELASRGEFVPVIDRSLSFEHIREAHALVDSGRKRGSVVLTLGAG